MMFTVRSRTIASILVAILILCGCSGTSHTTQEPSAVAGSSEEPEQSVDEVQENTQVDSTESPAVATKTQEESGAVSIEQVDAELEVFSLGGTKVCVSAFFAIKNTGSVNLRFRDMSFVYRDKNDNLLSVDSMINSIPEALKPGQVGYIYSYYHDVSSADLSNGISVKPEGQFVEAKNYYEIAVEEAVFNNDGHGLDITVMGMANNQSGRQHSFTKPGAVFFDKEGSVMGFCYGVENFENGQKKSFTISGDVMSRDFDPKNVERVEVYIQGDDSF